MRLPFLAKLSLAAAVATALAVAFAWQVTGGAIASPGELSARRGDGARRHGVGAHADLSRRCGSCHAGPGSSTTTSDLCVDCHDEIRAELRARSGLHGRLDRAAGCLACHTEHRGRSASLTEMDPAAFPHDATGFALSGHRRTREGASFRCPDCHERDLGRFDEARCAGCHREDERDFLAGHLRAWGADCLACHDGVDRFGDGRFDHRRTDFALEGAHAAAPCAGCHVGVRSLRAFRDAPSACVDCHRADDAHEGRYGTACGHCHGARAWKPATFDHARSAFPLTGAHVRVACGECHAGGRFEGTPTACVGCHEEPADHRGTFGPDCASCHGTETWRGATVRHTFPLDHGEGGRIACATCHPDGWRTYTCMGCHEHSPDRVARQHDEEGIADLSNCVRCHPTGREHEGEGEHEGRGREGGEHEDDD